MKLMQILILQEVEFRKDFFMITNINNIPKELTKLKIINITEKPNDKENIIKMNK